VLHPPSVAHARLAAAVGPQILLCSRPLGAISFSSASPLLRADRPLPLLHRTPAIRRPRVPGHHHGPQDYPPQSITTDPHFLLRSWPPPRAPNFSSAVSRHHGHPWIRSIPQSKAWIQHSSLLQLAFVGFGFSPNFAISIT
jgi:hypothetical protein